MCDKEPKSVVLLRNNQPIGYIYNQGFLTFLVEQEMRTEMDDVVKVVLY